MPGFSASSASILRFLSSQSRSYTSPKSERATGLASWKMLNLAFFREIFSGPFLVSPPLPMIVPSVSLFKSCSSSRMTGQTRDFEKLLYLNRHVITKLRKKENQNYIVVVFGQTEDCAAEVAFATKNV